MNDEASLVVKMTDLKLRWDLWLKNMRQGEVQKNNLN